MLGGAWAPTIPSGSSLMKSDTEACPHQRCEWECEVRQPIQLMRAVLGGLILTAVLCLSSSAAWAADSDADGVSDGKDNCALVANAGQQDSDLDGAGNACDFDYNNDGQVNGEDAALLQAAFGSGPDDPGYSDAFDADADGVIAGTDWGAFAAAAQNAN